MMRTRVLRSVVAGTAPVERAACRWWLLLPVVLLAALASAGWENRGIAAAGEGTVTDDVDGRREPYRSARLLLHTDLPEAAAADLAKRMETTLQTVADYWGRPARGQIECFVISDLRRWSDDELPHPLARTLIGRIEGAALAERIGAGYQARTEVRVLASARPGVAEHEVVHAYCGQTFGTTGPLWYQEGMAQLFALGSDPTCGANCTPTALIQLHTSPSRTLAQTVHGGDSTQRLIRQLAGKTSRDTDLAGLIPVSDWDTSDVKALEDIQRFYAWNWFLCHLLYHNPNYRARFDKLGQAYLTNRQDRFGFLFRPVWRELEFEYQFHWERLAAGYRVDLCSWDWDKTFRPLAPGRQVSVRIAASRGYQATGVELEAGRKYRYQATGTWRIDPQADPTDGDGDEHGHGRLTGVILNDFQLSAPLDLGASGRFRAATAGRLYVRCRDAWSRLGDNTGDLRVTFSR